MISLNHFLKMEIEAKQQAMRASKRTVEGSYIQYRSTTMPLHQVRKSNVIFPLQNKKIPSEIVFT